jgi:tRNA threonylcarbamoyladenosine biosynthesis protein TsaE
MDEFLALGPDGYFDADGVTFVEWADRVADLLPPERLEIKLDVAGETHRRITLSGTTGRMEAVLTHLKAMRD